ncbi:MAG: glycosyltransferase, partial [Pirellulales bacterium]
MLEGFCDPRLRYFVNAERTGLVAQRNRGLKIASGRYIAIMDADDVAHPLRLAKQLEFFDEHPDVGVIGSQIAVIDSCGHPIGHRCFPLRHDDILRALPTIVPLSHPTVMIRRQVIENFGGYGFVELAPADDYEYWSRLIQHGVRFANHPDVLLSYRLHAGQLKFARLRETILSDLRVKELYWSDNITLNARLWRQA